MNVFQKFTCIYHDFDATVVSRKLGDNIVTVTNNVLHTFLKIFAVVKCLPCFPIIADTGKLIKNCRITKGTFLHEFCAQYLNRTKSTLSGRNGVEMSPSSCERFPKLYVYQQREASNTLSCL